MKAEEVIPRVPRRGKKSLLVGHTPSGAKQNPPFPKLEKGGYFQFKPILKPSDLCQQVFLDDLFYFRFRFYPHNLLNHLPSLDEKESGDTADAIGGCSTGVIVHI